MNLTVQFVLSLLYHLFLVLYKDLFLLDQLLYLCEPLYLMISLSKLLNGVLVLLLQERL